MPIKTNITINYETMNAKETELHRIIDVVIGCCATEIQDGAKTITKEDVFGRNRSENVVMTRCIIASQIISAGYSLSTVAFILNRTVQSVRHMIEIGANYNKTSRAYRIANEEATRKCKENAA